MRGGSACSVFCFLSLFGFFMRHFFFYFVCQFYFAAADAFFACAHILLSPAFACAYVFAAADARVLMPMIMLRSCCAFARELLMIRCFLMMPFEMLMLQRCFHDAADGIDVARCYAIIDASRAICAEELYADAFI